LLGALLVAVMDDQEHRRRKEVTMNFEKNVNGAKYRYSFQYQIIIVITTTLVHF
jgi:hypothetical protein